MVRIQLSEQLKAALLNQINLPQELEVGGRIYRPQEPVAGGFKGVVWKVRDEHGRLVVSTYQDANHLISSLQARIGNRVADCEMVDDLP